MDLHCMGFQGVFSFEHSLTNVALQVQAKLFMDLLDVPLQTSDCFKILATNFALNEFLAAMHTLEVKLQISSFLQNLSANSTL